MSAAVDLFAGPGGWDIAALALQLEVVGIEWDDAACATRRAAGLRTEQADVSVLDPTLVLDLLNASRRAECEQEGIEYPGDLDRLDGLIASPPCQAFSMAGKGEGRKALDAYMTAMRAMVAGNPIDIAALDEACGDPRGHLVLEPLRWALALRPAWVACEQVEPVLPLWEEMAAALREIGYSTATGVLSAEQYGVPQTRKRAILVARLDGTVQLPRPTHQRYIVPQRQDRQDAALFEAPEPERIVIPEDRQLLPWVSMADALGWSVGDKIGFPRLNDIAGESGEYRERDLRLASQAAFAITEKARSWQRWHYRNGNQANAAVRALDEPAPTLHFGHAMNSGVEWVTDPEQPWEAGRDLEDGLPAFKRHASMGQGMIERHGDRPTRPGDAPAPVIDTNRRPEARIARTHSLHSCPQWQPSQYDSRSQRDGRTGALNRRRATDEPAPTIAGQSCNDSWTQARPATVIQGDPRVFPPGGHEANDGRDNEKMVGRSENAVRVSITEAAVLQSFPPNYPWQGTRTKIFEQIGNAVPPLLAFAVLHQLVGES